MKPGYDQKVVTLTVGGTDYALKDFSFSDRVEEALPLPALPSHRRTTLEARPLAEAAMHLRQLALLMLESAEERDAEEARYHLRMLVDAVDLSAFGMRVRLYSVVNRSRLTRELSLSVRAELEAKDLHGAGVVYVTSVLDVRGLEKPHIGDPYAELRWFVGKVHELVRGLVLHEVDECFKFAGQRPYDPHAAEGGK